MRKLFITFSIFLLAYAAPLVYAGTVVTQWEVDVNGVFDTDSVVWTAGSANTSVTPLQLRWGIPADGEKSGLDIVNSDPAIVLTNGPAVTNMHVIDHNFPITGSFLVSVILDSTLTLTPFVPSMPGLPPATISFQINYFETPNANDPCADGGENGVGVNENGCADIFVIDQSALSFPFFYDTGDGAMLYTISFFEYSGLTPLSDAACAAVLGAAACSEQQYLGFETRENQLNEAVFASKITVVPEPSALILLGSGLVGLGILRRKLIAKK